MSRVRDVLALPPEVPGYGYQDAWGNPLCTQYRDAVTGCFSAWAGTACCDGHACQCSLYNFPVCLGERAWVAVDLNLDGSGRPYRHFRGRNGDLPLTRGVPRGGTDREAIASAGSRPRVKGLPPYDGRGVPRLRDYDLTKDPATWMHDCPCETWTGASQCVI